MVEERLALAHSSRRDLVDAHFLIPGCDSKMLRLWREVDVGDAVFWRIGQGHILRELTECTGERSHLASERQRFLARESHVINVFLGSWVRLEPLKQNLCSALLVFLVDILSSDIHAHEELPSRWKIVLANCIGASYLSPQALSWR
jgi:hypothetical protein